MIATSQIVPKSGRATHLRVALDGLYGRLIYKYTVSPDGVFTLYGTMAGTVRDVVTELKEAGLTA
jgi:hypothetical protein